MKSGSGRGGHKNKRRAPLYRVDVDKGRKKACHEGWKRHGQTAHSDPPSARHPGEKWED